MKNTLLSTYSRKILVRLANRKYEELSYPKNQKKCDPTLVTLLKMRPYPAGHPPRNDLRML